MAKLDVYRDWLKIEATNRPLTYYQLLKLNQFEDNTLLIRKRYRELNAYIRKFATGEFIDESQALLNELAKAMLCLTDAERKEEYDHSLGRKSEEQKPAGFRRSLEDILLANKILTLEQVKKAKSYAEAIGVELQMAILQQKLAAPEVVMLAYAESAGLPFINLDEIPVDEYYAPQINPVTARQHSFVPVMADMGKLILASPAPVSLDVEEELRVLFDMPVRCAICTPAQVNAAIAKYYPRGAVQTVVQRENGPQIKTEKTKPVKPQRSKTVKEAAAPLSPEAKKKRLQTTIIAVNFGIMVSGFLGAYVLKWSVPGIIGIAIPVALVAGGVAWVLTSKETGDEEA